MQGPSTTDTARLLDLLGDADADVRLQAVLDLGQARHGPAAPALVERFAREWDFQVREALTWATLRMDDTALSMVRTALGDPRWPARLQATHTLSKVGAPKDTVRLLPVVDDPVDCVAARAYWAVAQCGDPVAVPALVDQLARGTSEHRNSLLVALDAFGGEAVPALVTALRHAPAGGARRHAADVLAFMGAPVADPAEPALVAALDDPDEWVRIAALNGLGQLRTTTAWETVESRTGSDGRPGLLARRLVERRPPDRVLARHRVRTDPRVDDAVGPPPTADPGRWPEPDHDLVTHSGGPLADRLGPMLALQVAVARPAYLSRAEVPVAVLGAVHDDAHRAAIDDGRDAVAAGRVAAGAVEQYVHDHVFEEQMSVADPGKLVKDLLRGTEVAILDFVRAPAPRTPPGPTTW
ncbi:HEAT repeat domain-containing protein [Salsipaludibacter albus]|uniref:HEAT repeat domain-containing protein n=1 Tax=Salsipaludibacter albus TaxID=2849650 RepID=UPI001EE3CF99|nr:HEAT repeat domain-containing protein [Salsipaludibacter albus]MBY5164011.1 HEAT repeat domain-containing protein [Salsipaludibacter albus]